MRVGIVGAGLQGKRRARALKELDDNQLIIVADTNQDAAMHLAKDMDCQATTRWEEVVDCKEVDIVLVCTPPHLHSVISIASMRNGKHVLCEKPMGRNPEEAEQILNVARQTGMKLKCGLNLRHHPGIRQAWQWFNEGLIGEIHFIRCHYGIGGRPNYHQEWRAKVEISGGGEVMDQGIHALDLCRWFLGDFSEVFGMLSTHFWDIAPLEDNAFILLRSKKEQIASINVSWTQWKPSFSFDILGNDGYISLDGLGGVYGVERVRKGKRAFLEPFQEEVVEFPGEDLSWQEEFNVFISAIKENREPIGNGVDALEALKLARFVYQSAQKKEVVKI